MMKQLRQEIPNYEELKGVIMSDETLSMIESQMNSEMYHEANKIIKMYPEKEHEVMTKFEEIVEAMVSAINGMKGKNLSLENVTESLQLVLEGCNIPEYMQ